VKRNKKTYSFFNVLSAAMMIATLLWLTISTPFVFAAQQEINKNKKDKGTIAAQVPVAENEEEAANPFGNTTEEKTSGGTNLTEEFLHDHQTAEHLFSATRHYPQSNNAGTYIAFHGELLVPPPNIIA
jgi:hypothetical protein